MKCEVKEVKRAPDFRWGMSFVWDFEQNEKMFRKEVKRVRKGGSRSEETVKHGNGRLVKENEA